MLYKFVKPVDGALLQYVGVHVLRWKPAWGMPTAGFVEIESDLPHTSVEVIAMCEKLDTLQAALRKIAEYDTDATYGQTDEWSQAGAFLACMKIAREALGDE